MSSVFTPREWSTSYSASPKSSPTGPTTRTSVKKLAASEKCTAEPPSIRSRSPNGVFTASNAIDPTTTRLMAARNISAGLSCRTHPALEGAALRRLVLYSSLVVLFALASAASAAAATDFQLGKGAHPDVYVDTTGTAHVVWDEY